MDSSAFKPTPLRLKKGELLFSEGDHSTAMYLLKSGMIRLFMSRGGSVVEIATIRPGEIVGELAFLDNNPRSVSGEALVDCDLVEISAPVFKDVLNHSPDWLKILFKTVVGRLRAVNTRIRQLEAATPKGKSGISVYQYLSLLEMMKTVASFIIVTCRNPVRGDLGIEVDLEKAEFYSHQIMGVPLTKTLSVIDLLVQAGAMKARDEKGVLKAYLLEPEFLEGLNSFLYRESQRDPTQKKEVSIGGFLVLDIILNEIQKANPPDKDPFILNLGLIRRNEPAYSEKKAFKNEDVSEVFALGYVDRLEIKSVDDVTIEVKPGSFLTLLRFLKVLRALKVLNDQKRKMAGISK